MYNLIIEGNHMVETINANFRTVQNKWAINPVKPNAITFRGGGKLKNDIFIKSPDNKTSELQTEYPTAVAGKKFIQWADETGFIGEGKLKEALKPKNLIGVGFEHAVYHIPGNEDYVLRIPRNYYLHTQETDFSNYHIQDTADPELTRNCGQQAALISDKETSGIQLSPSIEVLIKQKGYANGNPPPEALYHEDGRLREEAFPYEDNSRKTHFAHCLKTLAEMPDETYDLLIEDLIVSGEAGYKFDHLNSNNFLIDENTQKINIIDMGKTVKPHKDRFGNTLYALTNIEFLEEYLRKDSGYEPENPNEINKTIGNMITVMEKYTKAVKNHYQKYNKNSYEFHKLLNNLVSSFWLKTNSYEEKLEKLKQMDVLYDPERPGEFGSVKIK